jgi:hypothetical protein
MTGDSVREPFLRLFYYMWFSKGGVVEIGDPKLARGRQAGKREREGLDLEGLDKMAKWVVRRLRNKSKLKQMSLFIYIWFIELASDAREGYAKDRLNFLALVATWVICMYLCERSVFRLHGECILWMKMNKMKFLILVDSFLLCFVGWVRGIDYITVVVQMAVYIFCSISFFFLGLSPETYTSITPGI